jgi:predicted MPP superfamily phosphohydrolase
MEKPAEPATKSKITRRKLLQLGALAVAATTVDGYIGSEAIKLERKTLRLPKWDADGLRIAQVSDVHVNSDSMRDVAMDAVRMAIATKPDIFVFTGDFVNKAHDDTLRNVTQVFSLLHDVDFPCFAILGNHDYTTGNTRRLFETVRQTPLTLLQNDIVDVHGISLVGLDDAYFGHYRPQILRDPGLSRSTLVLLHEPDYVDNLPGSPSLVLSGHSHGGEICLPTGIPIHTPEGARKYKKGLYPHAKHPLYVSRGVASLSHFRIFCPPEVTLFTLNSA